MPKVASSPLIDKATSPCRSTPRECIAAAFVKTANPSLPSMKSRRQALQVRASLLLIAALVVIGMTTNGAEGSRGHLFIIGGGRQPAGMIKHFIELAGGATKAK